MNKTDCLNDFVRRSCLKTTTTMMIFIARSLLWLRWCFQVICCPLPRLVTRTISTSDTVGCILVSWYLQMTTEISLFDVFLWRQLRNVRRHIRGLSTTYVSKFTVNLRIQYCKWHYIALLLFCSMPVQHTTVILQLFSLEASRSRSLYAFVVSSCFCYCCCYCYSSKNSKKNNTVNDGIWVDGYGIRYLFFIYFQGRHCCANVRV